LIPNIKKNTTITDKEIDKEIIDPEEEVKTDTPQELE